ncbi:MAG TPA: glutamate-5-semialdehyde dehydrogenase [Nitrospirae bacterium]|nr:glutamate-5-semialdehyde dehydrogenase [Nitrospirota bacterium]
MELTVLDEIEKIARAAREASREMAAAPSSVKNSALLAMADALEKNRERIFDANKSDLDEAKKNGLSGALLDRLKLDDKRVSGMAGGIREVVALDDPVGEILNVTRRPNGMRVGQMRVPLGVIGIIYESRPNVTADTAALCLKSGNAVVLRGGSEAIHSNRAIADILSSAIVSVGIPQDAISLIPTTDREAVKAMLKMDKYIDVIIPRGGYELIRFVTENSVIPVIKHDKGLCHVYIDASADIKMAGEIAFNSKVQRPGVCNAAETMLVHKDIAGKFLPGMIKRLQEAGVEIRGCDKTRELAPDTVEATPDDWDEEYLDLILSVKVVDSIDDAMSHIAQYGSAHTETIVTNDKSEEEKFLKLVDSSAVMVNASTRFNDGGQFGLGAEIGISTQKLHARGPMGLKELTSLKYIVYGEGQIRE